MKKTINVLGFAILFMVFAMASCNKNTDTPEDNNIANKVTGVYDGNLIISSSNSVTFATSNISRINDYTIQVHCFGDSIDTTIFLELYPNGNQMMVCSNDTSFFNEYGHEHYQNHHMMNSSSGNYYMNWGQHLETDHQANDIHHGYFDLTQHQFKYDFEMENSSGNLSKQFAGTRK